MKEDITGYTASQAPGCMISEAVSRREEEHVKKAQNGQGLVHGGDRTCSGSSIPKGLVTYENNSTFAIMVLVHLSFRNEYG